MAPGQVHCGRTKDRDTNMVNAQVVEAADAENLQKVVDRAAAEDATVYTDEAKAYKGMPPRHET